MKNKAVIGIVVILLLTVGFLLGIFVDDFMKPSKEKTLAMLFAYPDGSACENPCLLGIQPGVTSVNRAKELMNSHPLTKGGEIFVNDYSGMNYLDILLQNNGLRLQVDYEKDLVLEVDLDDSFIRGVGYRGVNLNGYKFTFEDILPFVGMFEQITASSGDGGMISQVVALNDSGWCVYSANFEEDMQPTFRLSVPSDAFVSEIGIGCYWLQFLDE